ncbi:hypothetical protein TSUD_274940 [Trifolium subterraneum]|uniref:Uncharacterized protein n=1 Tax=Trifolium subterraneum TaxID=3900 RepID=A0A2Z6NF54_TRISU|nr:hypothetical protein TSUD_274940 [Trifolium subterraneum]
MGVEKGMWGAVMSPYETRYVDVKIDGELSGLVTVSLEEVDYKFNSYGSLCEMDNSRYWDYLRFSGLD